MYPPTMTVKLDNILDEARTALSTADQDALADVIATYVATHSGDANDLLSEAQQAELARRHATPFDPAGPDEATEFFTKHGA